MKTCGLDIATCTGMALVGEEEDRGTTIHLQKITGFLRLQLVADNVERTLRQWQPDLVMVESYAYCKNVNSFITLVELGTVIRQVLYDLKWSWCEVNPKTLKKWTTGSGAAKKPAMAEAVLKRWNYTSKSDDIVDAYALAQMGQLDIVELIKLPGVFYQKR